MTKLTFLVISIVFLSMAAFLPDDNYDFPIMSGTNLAGKNISLPLDAHGKYALIGMVRSMKAEQDMISWIEPVYASIAGNSMFQVKMYFIPMTGGIEGVSTETVKRKLKESMDSSLYKYVFLYTGPVQEYVKKLGMKDKDLPYIYVVDPRGKVTYVESGKYTEKKLENITDKLAE
jgi:ATP synthase subunit 10